jgi:TonB family protein
MVYFVLLAAFTFLEGKTNRGESQIFQDPKLPKIRVRERSFIKVEYSHINDDGEPVVVITNLTGKDIRTVTGMIGAETKDGKTVANTAVSSSRRGRIFLRKDEVREYTPYGWKNIAGFMRILNENPKSLTYYFKTIEIIYTDGRKEESLKDELPPGITRSTPDSVRVTGPKKPRKIKHIEPVYPQIAKKAHIQGTVVIDVITDIYGRVIRTRIINGPPLLRQAAVRAVKQWIFEPFIMDGVPRSARFTVTTKFFLKD